MTTKTRAADAAQPTAAELVSDAVTPTDGESPLPPGPYINIGAVDLVLTQPSAVVKPGYVIELEFGIRHRDLRPATDAEIKAAGAAAAAQNAATGQE